MYDLVALRGEEHEDRVEQADEGPRGQVRQEDGVVPVSGEKGAEGEAREDCGGEGDAEEDADAGGDGAVGDGDLVCAAVADDFDEEDGERGVEDHLEDGVDGHEDGAVFFVAAGEVGPD